MLKYTGITGIRLSIITKFLVVGPFEKIRKHAIYDIHGSAFACKDLIFSFAGGVHKSVHTLGGVRKSTPCNRGRGAQFPFFCIHTLWTTPNESLVKFYRKLSIK